MKRLNKNNSVRRELNIPAVTNKYVGSVYVYTSVLNKDTAFQYLWNCKQYLDKVSRIVLATDGDSPGQALAEELACRLGKERCWQVSWPKKEECSYFKDANEVLRCMGPNALKKIIENTELYYQSMI